MIWLVLIVETHHFAVVQERRKDMPVEAVLLDSLRVSTHALHQLHQQLASHRRMFQCSFLPKFLRQP